MEVPMRTVLFMLRILGWLVAPIFWLLSRRKTEKIPPIGNQLLMMSATSLAEKIRKRQLKSETIVEAYIARIKEVNRLLNAVVEERFDAALQEARDIDSYLATISIDEPSLKLNKPLLGVPVTIKECCGVKGMSQSVGTKMREGMRTEKEGAAVARIREAGGVILLISNTPEYVLYWECNNQLTGRTNNPYNLNCSPGGSSGGEGALLGSGASILGIGSDICGSIRMPALLNGVFGHKGSSHLVPTEGHVPRPSSPAGNANLVIGPMVRYAEDLPLLFNVLVPSAKELRLNEPVDLKKLKVFFMHDTNWCIAQIYVDNEIKQAINKCVEHLRANCGSTVDEFKFGLRNALEISAAVLLNEEDMPKMLEPPQSTKKTHWLGIELLKSLFGCSKFTFHALIFNVIFAFRGFHLPFRRRKFLNELEDLKKEFQEHLKTDGVLLCPTFPSSSYAHNEFIFKFSGVQYQGIFNNLELPSTNVPLGTSNGMPLGIQVIAARGQDRLCFAVARELEKAFGGWTPPS